MRRIISLRLRVTVCLAPSNLISWGANERVDRWSFVPGYAFGRGKIGGSDADLGWGRGLDLQL